MQSKDPGTRRSLEEVKKLIDEINALFVEASVPVGLNVIGQYTFADLGMTLTYGAKGCSDTCTGCKGSCSGTCDGCTGCSGCTGTTQSGCEQQQDLDGFFSMLQDPRVSQILAFAANKG
ncbi:MAG: hypothetical protein HYY09_08725 [Firmicutes bacterium]|nr:hypothetical protein [Bacillota bacterium]